MLSQPHQPFDFAAPSPNSYAELARVLSGSGCAVVPTETVYGLIARADDKAACKALYAIKGRSFDKPLPVCVTSTAQASALAELCPLSRKLIEAFWPGPLTLVLPLKAGAKLAPHAIGPGHTVALRLPDCGWAAYLNETGFDHPLALTSANPSGAPSPVSAQDVKSTLDLTSIALGLDGGPCASAQASTIVLIKDGMAKLLREGALPRSAFETFNMSWITP